MEPVIKVEDLGKRYLLRHQQTARYTALRDVMSNKARALFSGNKSDTSKEEFWALKEVNFEIQQGDRLGIIGRNGAGKSTLLKVLSRITEPTTGRITINGRIASLLEVGTGFHPELTGRENIFLNGSILGMSKTEIKRKFDEIVAFAEIERFLDTPVKRYSSGMYVRLAFAVAAHLEPEILIVDEVLAVGDSQFQKKCLGKMEDISGSGRTILFVSHQMETVSRLCNKGLLLQQGKVIDFGPAEKIIHTYLRSDTGTTAHRSWTNNGHPPGNEIVRLLDVKVHDRQFVLNENFDVTMPIGVSMEYEVLRDGDIFSHSFNFFNEQGVNIFNTHDTTSLLRKEARKKGIYKATMWIPGNLLNEGITVVGVAAIQVDPFNIHFHELDAVSFNVIDHMRGDSARGEYILGFPGMVRPLCQWETIKK